ncbi:hypothetical protein XELAEV_18028684mg [Xenopus laevis]|uniref:Cytochrome c oxidase subunit 5B, mitochondrial n=1 Tax=Xenopus laevis TaxID=8355 RepID=A0A974CRI5_XENLA|nr:hypothetical protein XELAEV_18028684mg [Xenopus laevis]
MATIKPGTDPYSMMKPQQYAGNKEDPHIVHSITNKRIVGCICEEENTNVIWFWLHEGETKHLPILWLPLQVCTPSSPPLTDTAEVVCLLFLVYTVLCTVYYGLGPQIKSAVQP